MWNASRESACPTCMVAARKRIEALEGALKSVRELSALCPIVRGSPPSAFALFGNIHQTADAALDDDPLYPRDPQSCHC